MVGNCRTIFPKGIKVLGDYCIIIAVFYIVNKLGINIKIILVNILVKA